MTCYFKAAVALIVLTINTLFWGIPLVLVSFLKFILPFPAVRRAIGRVLVWFAENWVAVNAFLFRLLNGEKITVRGLENVKPDQWYLVISNHQSWVDIPVLQTVFHKKVRGGRWIFPLCGAARQCLLLSSFSVVKWSASP